MMKPALFFLLLVSLVPSAHAISLSAAQDVCEAARQIAKAYLLANPNRRLGCIADTKSMLPTFDAGYIVVMEPKPFASLKQDDIVTFNAEWAPTTVVHRLHWQTRSGWVTKGDNLTRVDPTLLTEKNYTGAVVIAAIHKRTGRVEILH